MAVHYYDEDNIEVGNPINTHVVVNHVVELTEEEKEQARQDAIRKVQDDMYNKLTQPAKKATTKKADTANNQPTLFDF
jgi:F0F1-type ATP synthase membrane subunit b/b'